MDALLMPILLLMSGILVGVVMKSLTKYIKLPYTVSLFAFGLIVGILYKFDVFQSEVLHRGIEQVANMNPDFVLYVFLPILVFDAAYEMNLHVFKKTLLSASLLAGPGLVIAMLMTAAMMMGLHWLSPETADWNWTFALMFGGLISATDPVAVVALLQELKTSRRFSTLVDGESLLNDGTGIVCFMLFYGTFANKAPELGPIAYFLWVCFASFIIGYIIAKVTLWFITKVTSEPVVQNSAMIIAAYLTFIIAQHTLDVSGVIALVSFGHIFSQSGRPRMKAETNEFIEKFWGLLAHIANTLIFIIVGIIIAAKVEVTWMSIVQIFAVYIGLNLIRYIMIAVLYPLLKRCGYGLTLRESVILGWGGLRGALGMSLALMVNYTTSIPESIRNQVLLLTAGVVTLTLCVNATTSKWLLGKMKLVKGESVARNRMSCRIHDNIRKTDESYLETIKKEPALAEVDWKQVEAYLPASVEIPEDTSEVKDVTPEIRIMLLDKERSTVNNLYEQGVISKHTFSRIIESIDDVYDYEGERELNHRHVISTSRGKWLKVLEYVQKILDLLTNNKLQVPFLVDLVAEYYDLCRGFILTQEASKELLQTIATSDIISKKIEDSVIAVLQKEIDSNCRKATIGISLLQREFPRCYGQAVTKKAIRMLLAGERGQVAEMCHSGVVTTEEALNLLQEIDKRQASEIHEH